MNAYSMVKRCWDAQPTGCVQDAELYALMVEEHLFSQEAIAYTGAVLEEEDVGYPGAYALPREGSTAP